MELKELKNKILNKESLNFPIIFSYENYFLVNTYIEAISKNLNIPIKELNDLAELDDIKNNIFDSLDYLYIFRLKKDNKLDLSLLSDSHIIILCDYNIDIEGIDIVKFSNPVDWQVEDYISKLIPGLNAQEIKWLCKVSNYNLDRLYLEAEKINIFNFKDQKMIFQLINEDNGYSDLNDLSIFNLSNAIIKRNYADIKNILKDIDNIDIEGTGLCTILLRQFLNIINIQMNSRATAQSLNMSDKQFSAISYNCNKYSDKELVKIYKFLTSIDYKLKSGLLDIENKEIVYYIINNIISKGV